MASLAKTALCSFDDAMKSFSISKRELDYVLENREKLSSASWAFNILQAAFESCNGLGSSAEAIRKSMADSLANEIEALIPRLNLDVINAISGERYESADGKDFALTFIPYLLNKKQIEAVGLEETILFPPQNQEELSLEKVHAIRKQLNMTKNTSLAVCECMDDGIPTLKTMGILPAGATKRFIHISFTGHMEWRLYVPLGEIMASGESARCRILYKQGRLLLPHIDITEYWFKDICNKLSLSSIGKDIKKILQHISQKKKGALLVVAETNVIKNEARRLCKKYNHGFLMNPPFSLCDKPDELDQLASIDGAVLVDVNGCCYSYGTILDGKACVEGNMSRGARFNSACNYAHNQRKLHRKIIAFVVSEDGMVDVV